MDNLSIIEKYHLLLWGDKDLSAIDHFFHNDAIIHSPLETTQCITDLASVVTTWFSAFPNLNVIWDDYVCQGDKVVSQWHANGVHEGEFLGKSATHRTIRYSGVSIYQIFDGKVKEYWAFLEMGSIQKQLA